MRDCHVLDKAVGHTPLPSSSVVCCTMLTTCQREPKYEAGQHFHQFVQHRTPAHNTCATPTNAKSTNTAATLLPSIFASRFLCGARGHLVQHVASYCLFVAFDLRHELQKKKPTRSFLVVSVALSAKSSSMIAGSAGVLQLGPLC